MTTMQQVRTPPRMTLAHQPPMPPPQQPHSHPSFSFHSHPLAAATAAAQQQLPQLPYAQHVPTMHPTCVPLTPTTPTHLQSGSQHVNTMMGYNSASAWTFFSPLNSFLNEYSWRCRPDRRPLQIFVHAILKDMQASRASFLVALIYIYRFNDAHSAHRANVCGHCLFLSALLLSSKYLNDKTYGNAYWAKVARYPLGELNDLEAWLLDSLDYSLYVPNSLFDAWIRLYTADQAKYMLPHVPTGSSHSAVLSSTNVLVAAGQSPLSDLYSPHEAANTVSFSAPSSPSVHSPGLLLSMAGSAATAAWAASPVFSNATASSNAVGQHGGGMNNNGVTHYIDANNVARHVQKHSRHRSHGTLSEFGMQPMPFAHLSSGIPVQQQLLQQQQQLHLQHQQRQQQYLHAMKSRPFSASTSSLGAEPGIAVSQSSAAWLQSLQQQQQQQQQQQLQQQQQQQQQLQLQQQQQQLLHQQQQQLHQLKPSMFIASHAQQQVYQAQLQAHAHAQAHQIQGQQLQLRDSPGLIMGMGAACPAPMLGPMDAPPTTMRVRSGPVRRRSNSAPSDAAPPLPFRPASIAPTLATLPQHV